MIRYIALAGAILIVVGSFLPWATVMSMFGTLSVSGIEGDGMILVVVGSIVALSLLYHWQNGGRDGLAGVAALIALLIGIYEYSHVSGVINTDSEHLVTKIGVGLYIVIFGSLLALASFGNVEESTKVCPICAEKIKNAAAMCRYCGYDMDSVVTE